MLNLDKACVIRAKEFPITVEYGSAGREGKRRKKGQYQD
jgi:hypothetical protein